jgi:hypothetical protein
MKRKPLQDQVVARIKRHGKGWAFTPRDFVDLGNPRSVGMVLSRLVKVSTIRRVAQGIYEVPKPHPLIGTVGADVDEVVQAVARKRHLVLLPTGAYAANRLGLSEQVPAKVVYITNGGRSSFKMGKLTVTFRPGSSRSLALAGRASGLVVQALRAIGQRQLTARQVDHLRRVLPDAAKAQLLADVNEVPAWMRPIFREVAANGH